MVLPGRSIPRFLFCEHHHVSNLFVLQTPPIAPPIAQLPLSSKFLIFILPSLFHSFPLPPSHLWWVFNDNFVIAGDLVQLFIAPWWIWWLLFFTVAASLLYRMCMGCMVRYFPYTRFTVPFVPLVGVSLPYHVRVLFQYTPYGKIVSVHPVYSTRVLFLPSARHYSIIRMYSSTRRIVR